MFLFDFIKKEEKKIYTIYISYSVNHFISKIYDTNNLFYFLLYLYFYFVCMNYTLIYLYQRYDY